ncbi:MAG: YobA family protein [Gudongella sp.]|nr:YobA family protein [Gudongella sp.]
MNRKLLLVLIVVLGVMVAGCSQEVTEEFVGTITEINGLTAIVQPDEDEEIRNSGDLVEVSLSVSDNFEFMVGDRVKVTHNGQIQEKYPLGIETISVELIERVENPEEEPGEDDDSAYNKISEYLKGESIEAFSPYYELLEFRITDYREEEVDGKTEAEFLYTIVSKNYDRDPDTVGYIIEAKENGSDYYQQLYDEYLQPKEMNFNFKVVMDEEDNMTLYSNVSPNGVEWEESRMTDYILTEKTGFTGIGYDLDYKDRIFPGMSDKEVSAAISRILDAARLETDKGEVFQLTEEIAEEYGIEGLDPEYMNMLDIMVR